MRVCLQNAFAVKGAPDTRTHAEHGATSLRVCVRARLQTCACGSARLPGRAEQNNDDDDDSGDEVAAPYTRRRLCVFQHVGAGVFHTPMKKLTPAGQSAQRAHVRIRCFVFFSEYKCNE